MKYDTRESPINAIIRPIVILCKTFSGPRRSNFPKSPEPGMIESPPPFAWSIVTTMMMSASMMSAIWRRDIKNGKIKTRIRADYIKE